MKKIIWNEDKLVEKLLEHGFTNQKRNSAESICLVSYWKNVLGLKPKALMKKFTDYCETFDENYNYVLCYKWVDSCIKWGSKKILKQNITVTVTKSELEKIAKLDLDLQKMMFTILVVAKGLRKKPSNRLFLNDWAKDKIRNTIRSSCGMRVSKKQYPHLIHRLFKLGLIGNFNIFKMETSFEILMVDDNSEPAIVIDNLDNLIEFLPLMCNKCGVILEKKTKHSGLCPACYKLKRKEDVRLNVQKLRAAKKVVIAEVYEF